MEDCQFPTTSKIPSVQIKSQNNVADFLKIKEILKGRHFDDTDDIRRNIIAALKAIRQNQFQNCFGGWTKRWGWGIASQGEYFEGDHSGFQQ
jgi:hypothetical protein